MEFPAVSRGRGRGRKLQEYNNSESPSLSQYILPETTPFSQYELPKMENKNKNSELKEYSQIISAIQKAAAESASIVPKPAVDVNNNPADYEFVSKYKVVKKQPQVKKPTWTIPNFDDDDEDDDSCAVCDRPDKNVFCKTCSHSWKGRIRVKCDKHPSTVMLMDSIDCPLCHSDDIKEI